MNSVIEAKKTVATSDLLATVEQELASTSFVDMHTHLFMPSLGDLGLWGIDQLITYHYLEAELFRSSPITPEKYWTLTTTQKADLIWKTLFVENEPVSEATRGVIAVLQTFGLPTDTDDLTEARKFFAAQHLTNHISNVFRLSGISSAVMTNDPLDPAEAPLWEKGVDPDPRFQAVLRLDRVLNKWDSHWGKLAAQGYRVDEHCSPASVGEVRRFLDDWVRRMRPVYMAVSLPDTFRFPEDSVCGRLLHGAVLPACRDFRIPLSLMIGVRYLVNPALKLAGDASGVADLRALEYLCLHYPDNRFLTSLLSRENQHELCVYARKFRNLMPFGCWWFLNNPSIVEEITRERLEMLGTSFIPQHSDARVLEQVIYKWRNTRRTLAPILADKYRLLSEDGRGITRAAIQRDITRLFRTNFEAFAGTNHV
jgi:hypothetical protein